jgi:hypothetical protein
MSRWDDCVDELTIGNEDGVPVSTGLVGNQRVIDRLGQEYLCTVSLLSGTSDSL